MQFKPLKGLLLATSAVAALSFMATTAKAADNAAMSASVTSVGALTVTNLNNMNFGKWLLTHDGAEDIYIILNPTTGIATAASDNLGAALATSTATLINNTARAGRIGVTIPANAALNNYTLQMTVTDPTDFTTPANYVLDQLTYSTATENTPTLVVADGLATHPVTVITAGTAETVYFGGVVQVDQQPDSDAADTGVTFTATFNY